eukprot:gene17200-20499_t
MEYGCHQVDGVGFGLYLNKCANSTIFSSLLATANSASAKDTVTITTYSDDECGNEIASFEFTLNQCASNANHFNGATNYIVLQDKTLVTPADTITITYYDDQCLQSRSVSYMTNGTTIGSDLYTCSPQSVGACGFFPDFAKARPPKFIKFAIATRGPNLRRSRTFPSSLQVGTGRLGGWAKRYASVIPSSDIVATNGQCFDIDWNWTLSLRYKHKYQYLYVKHPEDSTDDMIIDQSDQVVPTTLPTPPTTTTSSSFKLHIKESINSASQVFLDAFKTAIPLVKSHASQDVPATTSGGDAASTLVREMKTFLLKESFRSPSGPPTTDHLNMVIVQATGFDTESQLMMGCRVKVGVADSKRETIQKPSDHLFWKQYFDIPLAPALQRYALTTQMLIVYFLDHSTTPPTVVGESDELDLFTLQRDTIIEMRLPVTITDSRFTARTGAVHLLLKYAMGACSADEQTELLYQSVCAADEPLVSGLLRRGARLNSTFRENRQLETDSHTTPLIKAAKHGNIPLIKSLLDLGASVNFPDADGFTALMRAVQYEGVFQSSSIEVVRLLLDAGANPAARNKYGEDVFKFCTNKDMRGFMQSSIRTDFFELSTIVCPRCHYVEFPLCYESSYHTLKTRDCRCKRLTRCVSCEHTLSPADEKVRIMSLNELTDLSKHYTSGRMGPLSCQLSSMLSCNICQTFGFVSSDARRRALGEYGDLEDNDFSCHLSHLPSCPVPLPRLTKSIVTPKQAHILLHTARQSIAPHRPTFSNIANSSNTNSISPFQSLPHELILTIFGHINSWTDLSNCAQVSWLFQSVLSDNMFWRAKMHSACGPVVLARPPTSYKQLYHRYTVLAEWIRILLLEETFRPRYTISINGATGNVAVELTLTARKYLFNKDGISFNFDNEFKLSLEFSAIGTLESIDIHATGQSPSQIAELCQLMPIPPHIMRTTGATANNTTPSILTVDTLAAHQGTVSIHLRIQAKTIQRWINQYLKHMVPGFHSFLMIRDDVGGSIILDFFYYDIESI